MISDPKRWDVFICHVSEDENYIIQLKEAFVREKIDVFFAKDELSWGCELHRVINVRICFNLIFREISLPFKRLTSKISLES